MLRELIKSITIPSSLIKTVRAVTFGAAFLFAFSDGTTADIACPNGAEVKDIGKCRFFFKRTNPSNVVVDERISSRITPKSPLDPPVRSFALLVGVHSYPNFPDPKDRTLPPAAADITLLKGFLDRQKFDEIIVLEDADATKENVRYFLEVYLNNQLELYKMRSRVLFAFSGHGAPDENSNTAAGKIVLGPAASASDFENVYKLDELAPILRNLGNKSYHFIALLGSCFSGGIFSAVGGGGDNIYYPRAPGAHAVSATRSDELAYAFKNEAGSIFFTRLVNGVVTGNADRDYSN